MENITYNDEYFRNSDFVDEISSVISSSSLPTSSNPTIFHEVNGDCDNNGEDGNNNNNDDDNDDSRPIMLSKDVIQLLHMKELRIHDILQLKAKEDYRIAQINELKKQYGELRDIYQQAEYAMQMLVARETSEE